MIKHTFAELVHSCYRVPVKPVLQIYAPVLFSPLLIRHFFIGQAIWFLRTIQKDALYLGQSTDLQISLSQQVQLS